MSMMTDIVVNETNVKNTRLELSVKATWLY